jgi:hypothetical protein
MRRTKITAFIALTAVSAFLLVLSFTPLAGGATDSKSAVQENQSLGAWGNMTQYPNGDPTPTLGNYPTTKHPKGSKLTIDSRVEELLLCQSYIRPKGYDRKSDTGSLRSHVRW